MNAQRPPTATVTAAKAAQQEDDNSRDGGGDADVGDGNAATKAGGTGGGMAQHPVVARELGETLKPPGKPAGKRAKDKSELHSRIFDYLEKRST